MLAHSRPDGKLQKGSDVDLDLTGEVDRSAQPPGRQSQELLQCRVKG